MAAEYRNNTTHEVDIIFVCAGNTCRSFTALSFAKHLLSREPEHIQNKISLRSAGVNTILGKPGTAILMNLLKKDIPNFDHKKHSTMPLNQLHIDSRVPTYIYYAEASVENRIHYQTLFSYAFSSHPMINIIPICHDTPNIPDPDPDVGTRDDYIKMIELIKPCVYDIMQTHIEQLHEGPYGYGVGKNRHGTRSTRRSAKGRSAKGRSAKGRSAKGRKIKKKTKRKVMTRR